MTDIEFKEFTKFRTAPIAKSFDKWPPIGAIVRVKSGSFAGRTGIVLHQTTRHRYKMMIWIGEADRLFAKNELEVVK